MKADLAALRRVAMALTIAWRALSRNVLRTGLAVIGISIGTAAVIATVAIGEGGAAQIHQQLQMLGDNLVWVEAGGRSVNGVRTGSGATPTLVMGDMQAMLATIPELKTCSPQVDGGIQVIYGNQNWRTSFRGVSPEYVDIRRWRVATGELFTATHVETAANVCLLGQTVVDHLFADEDPVGKTIRIRNIPFKVLGTLGAKGQSAQGQDQDDTIFMPFTTAAKKIKGTPWFDDVMCSAVSAASAPHIEEQLTELLRERHHLFSGQADDFNIRRPEDIIKAQEEMAGTLSLLLASVAAVSLVVGGVGIMNIMLVSVTERIREIGLRMAVGARGRDVALQFLAEAVVLCLAGASAGVLVGVALSRGISEAMSWPMLISPLAVAAATVSATLTGLVFGYYPARKASRQDPIDALRYE